MHINEKLRHCFRQYFGPVHMYPPLLFENEDFLLLFDLVCFVLFSPVFFFGLSRTTVYPVTTVIENASYQNAFQSGDF